MLPQRKFAFSKRYKVASEAISDHFSSLVNLSLQLHMHAMQGREQLGHKGRGGTPDIVDCADHVWNACKP